MSIISIPLQLPSLLQPFKYANTGHIPQAPWMRALTNHFNHCRRWRGKELYSSPGCMTIPNSGGAARARQYFRCHTGFGTRRFVIAYSIGLAKVLGSGPPSVKFTATPVGGGSVITKTASYGPFEAGTTVLDALYEFGVGSIFTVDCLENKTYECEISDNQESRLQHILVFEEKKFEDSAQGYLDPVYAVGQGILDKHRKDLVEKASDLYLQNAAALFNFSSETDATAPVITGATETNIIDGTSTTISANSPGFYADLTYKRSLARTTVPAVFAVLAKTNASTGVVKLKDDTGTLITSPSITTTKGWFVQAGQVPADAKKRDVHAAATGGNNITVYAACLYMKD